jgi:hypothetical protein
MKRVSICLPCSNKSSNRTTVVRALHRTEEPAYSCSGSPRDAPNEAVRRNLGPNQTRCVVLWLGCEDGEYEGGDESCCLCCVSWEELREGWQ